MGKNRRTAKSGKAHPPWLFHGIRGRPLIGEKSVVTLQAFGIAMAVAWLCYDDFRGMVWLPAVWMLWSRHCRCRQKRTIIARRQQELKELLLMVSAAIQAGYSVENAFLEGEREMKDMFGNQSLLLPGLHEMNASVSMNVPLERAFAEFAKNIALEDADNFAQIFAFAKKAGGDYGKHIRRTALKIEEKIGIGQEIETLLTEKQLELKIMSWMPPGIILYVRLTSAEFMAQLYHNALGILIMTGCICIYGVLLMAGERIVAIDV